jgi:hypothetical protein
VTSPFLPPTETTGVVQPNRGKPAGLGRTLVLWLLLIVVFVAIYNVFAVDSARVPRVEPQDTRGSPIGWLVPLFTYLAMAGALFAIRRRLPEKYRTGELREIERPAPAVSAPEPASPIDLTLVGSDGRRPVRLEVNGDGLYWRAEARLLQPAEELRVRWDEIEAISAARMAAPLVVWGIMIGIFSAAYAVSVSSPEALIGIVIGIAVSLLGKARARGMLSFTTATHALTFQSKRLDAATRDRVIAAARARRPQAVAPPTAPNQRGALWLLFVDPFVHLALSFRSDAGVRAHLIRQASITPNAVSRDPEAEEARASVVQCRMFWVWNGVLCGFGPLSLGAGGIGAAESVVGFFAPWILGWLAGRIIVSRAMPLFARFSGMSLIR